MGSLKKLLKWNLIVGTIFLSSCSSYRGLISREDASAPWGPWDSYNNEGVNSDSKKVLYEGNFPRANKKVAYWYDGFHWRKERLKEE